MHTRKRVLLLERLSSKKIKALPEWVVRAKELRARQAEGLSQEEFARLLGVSTSEVRRWEQGRRAPTVAQAIALGKLAGAPDCWFWWRLAGLEEENVLAATGSGPPARRSQPVRRPSSRVAEETRVQLITALETILQRAPSAVIEEISRILTERAGKYGEPR